MRKSAGLMVMATASSGSASDLSGRHYSAKDLAARQATVFFFVSTQCPISSQYTPRMIEAARQYAPRGVAFFLADANADDSLSALRRYARERQFPFPVVRDVHATLADRLDAQATPEVVVVDANGAIRYLGRIDDNRDRARVTRHDLTEALDALLAGKPVARTRTLAFGCAIFRDAPAHPAAKAASVTYTRNVAKILNENCVSCHRPGDVGPFALTNYHEARTWAAAIKSYTAHRLMPPWKAAPGYGEFQGAHYLTDAQIATLGRWADTAAPEGNPGELPAPPRLPAPGGWPLGTPDAILKPDRDYHVAAEGPDVYRNFVLPADFAKDRYLSAMAFRPGNRAIVHHIIAYIDPKAISVAREGEDGQPGYTVPGTGVGIKDAEWGDGWAAGMEARALPPGVAIKIPAGAKIVMQVHYHKTGKPETDRTEIGLYDAKTPVEHRLQVMAVGNEEIGLTPGNPAQTLHARFQVPADATLRSIIPHMHMLGKEMKVTATLPDKTVKPLIWIKDWDFNWQMNYRYTQPIPLPAGTWIDLTAVYDNSEKNPRQTSHPAKIVRFGEQTTDEMCYAFLGFTVDNARTARSK